MSVHYKFKSSLDYDTVTFDGLHISVGDLKKSILQQKKIGKVFDFDLQITNAQTKEVYGDEESLIPKNASVIVSRVPNGNSSKKSWDRNDTTNVMPMVANDGSDSSLFDKVTKTADLTAINAPEEEKIRAMMSQSTQDYDPSRYVKTKGMTGPLPPNYTCYRCGRAGHWIKNCPTNIVEVKRSTGIPRSFMVTVEGPEVPGALLTSTGQYAVPMIDHEAYKEGKKERPPFSKELTPEKEDLPQIPEELLCMICRDLLSDAVLIPCCGNSYCDECVRQALLDSDEHECPTCHEKDISPDTLIPNRFLRTAVMNFKNETGYTKVKKTPPPKSEETPVAALADSTSSSVPEPVETAEEEEPPPPSSPQIVPSPVPVHEEDSKLSTASVETTGDRPDTPVRDERTTDVSEEGADHACDSSQVSAEEQTEEEDKSVQQIATITTRGPTCRPVIMLPQPLMATKPRMKLPPRELLSRPPPPITDPLKRLPFSEDHSKPPIGTTRDVTSITGPPIRMPPPIHVTPRSDASQTTYSSSIHVPPPGIRPNYSQLPKPHLGMPPPPLLRFPPPPSMLSHPPPPQHFPQNFRQPPPNLYSNIPPLFHGPPPTMHPHHRRPPMPNPPPPPPPGSNTQMQPLPPGIRSLPPPPMHHPHHHPHQPPGGPPPPPHMMTSTTDSYHHHHHHHPHPMGIQSHFQSRSDPYYREHRAYSESIGDHQDPYSHQMYDYRRDDRRSRRRSSSSSKSYSRSPSSKSRSRSRSSRSRSHSYSHSGRSRSYSPSVSRSRSRSPYSRRSASRSIRSRSRSKGRHARYSPPPHRRSRTRSPRRTPPPPSRRRRDYSPPGGYYGGSYRGGMNSGPPVAVPAAPLNPAFDVHRGRYADPYRYEGYNYDDDPRYDPRYDAARYEEYYRNVAAVERQHRPWSRSPPPQQPPSLLAANKTDDSRSRKPTSGLKKSSGRKSYSPSPDKSSNAKDKSSRRDDRSSKSQKETSDTRKEKSDSRKEEKSTSKSGGSSSTKQKDVKKSKHDEKSSENTTKSSDKDSSKEKRHKRKSHHSDESGTPSKKLKSSSKKGSEVDASPSETTDTSRKTSRKKKHKDTNDSKSSSKETESTATTSPPLRDEAEKLLKPMQTDNVPYEDDLVTKDKTVLVEVPTQKNAFDTNSEVVKVENAVFPHVSIVDYALPSQETEISEKEVQDEVFDLHANDDLNLSLDLNASEESIVDDTMSEGALVVSEDVLTAPVPELSKWELYDAEAVRQDELTAKETVGPMKQQRGNEKKGLPADIVQRAEKAILQKVMKPAVLPPHESGKTSRKSNDLKEQSLAKPEKEKEEKQSPQKDKTVEGKKQSSAEAIDKNSVANGKERIKLDRSKFVDKDAENVDTTESSRHSESGVATPSSSSSHRKGDGSERGGDRERSKHGSSDHQRSREQTSRSNADRSSSHRTEETRRDRDRTNSNERSSRTQRHSSREHDHHRRRSPKQSDRDAHSSFSRSSRTHGQRDQSKSRDEAKTKDSSASKDDKRESERKTPSDRNKDQAKGGSIKVENIKGSNVKAENSKVGLLRAEDKDEKRSKKRLSEDRNTSSKAAVGDSHRKHATTEHNTERLERRHSTIDESKFEPNYDDDMNDESARKKDQTTAVVVTQDQVKVDEIVEKRKRQSSESSDSDVSSKSRDSSIESLESKKKKKKEKKRSSTSPSGDESPDKKHKRGKHKKHKKHKHKHKSKKSKKGKESEGKLTKSK